MQKEHVVLLLGLDHFIDEEDSKTFVQNVVKTVFGTDPVELVRKTDAHWQWAGVDLVIYFPGYWPDIALLDTARELRKEIVFSQVEVIKL